MRLLLAALFFATPLAAGTITWEQVLAEASQSNPDLKISQADLRQAELSVRVARAAFLPSASASAGLGTGGAYKAPDSFGQGSDSASARLSASWDLFSGFGDLAGLAQAKALLAATEATVQETRARVGYELRAAFLGLLQAQERELQAQGIAKRRADNVDLVQLRFEAGREHQGSLLQTQAQAAQAAAAARRAQRDRARAAKTLAMLLGRNPDGTLRAAGELAIPLAPADGVPASLEGLPAVKRARLSVVSAQADKRKAQAAWWPSLGASASAGRSGRDWLAEDGSWSASLSLSIPLFQGGARLANTQAALSRLQEAELSSADAIAQARLDLDAAWDSLADAIDSAEVQAQFLKAGELRGEVAQAQYTQGLLGFEAWDQVESDLISAQTTALSTRGDAQRALAAWERALGRSPW